jgi:hypothetical protein
MGINVSTAATATDSGGWKGQHAGQFGNLVGLKPVNNIPTTNIETTTTKTRNKKPKIPKTRIIRISEDLYQRFHSHSKRYYNVEIYEFILNELLDCYEKHNEQYIRYFHLTRY